MKNRVKGVFVLYATLNGFVLKEANSPKNSTFCVNLGSTALSAIKATHSLFDIAFAIFIETSIGFKDWSIIFIYSKGKQIESSIFFILFSMLSFIIIFTKFLEGDVR